MRTQSLAFMTYCICGQSPLLTTFPERQVPLQANSGMPQSGGQTDEATKSYKELFTDPDNEWNAEMDSDEEDRGYLADMDNPDTKHLISGDGFNPDDVDSWNEK